MNLIVRTIAQSEDMATALGITKDRAIEIQKAVMHAQIDLKDGSEVAAEVSKIVKDPNELLYLGMVMVGKCCKAHPMKGIEV